MLHKTAKTWTLARPLPCRPLDMAATWQATSELPGQPMSDRERSLMRALFAGEISGAEAFLLLQAEMQSAS